jgi:hypothetical protein
LASAEITSSARGGARHRDTGRVERGDIRGGAHRRLLDLPLADHRAAAAGDGRVRGLERAARRFRRCEPGQGMGTPGRRQGQGGIGRAQVRGPRAAPRAPGDLHRAEQRGQQPAMAGLHPGPRDPVRARGRPVVLAGGLLLPRCPQVQVILQQLPLHLPAPLGQQVLQLARGQPGRLSGLQLFDQDREQIR